MRRLRARPVHSCIILPPWPQRRLLSLKELAAAFGEMASSPSHQQPEAHRGEDNRVSRHARRQPQPSSDALLPPTIHRQAPLSHERLIKDGGKESRQGSHDASTLTYALDQQCAGNGFHPRCIDARPHTRAPSAAVEKRHSPRHADGKNREHERASSTYGHRHNNITNSHPRVPSTVLDLATGHATRLATLQSPQLLVELEHSYRRLHLSSMILGLMELSRRLDLVAREQMILKGDGTHVGKENTVSCVAYSGAMGFHPISVAEAAGEVGHSSPRNDHPSSRLYGVVPEHLYCRSDRMLEAALRCLTKMNLSQLDPEIQLAVSCALDAGGVGTRIVLDCPDASSRDENPGEEKASPAVCPPTRSLREEVGDHALLYFAPARHRDFSHQLSQQLLTWLGARVSGLDAHRSVTFLHLLVQQRLFASDDIVTTLVDTLMVHMTTGSPTAVHKDSEGTASADITSSSRHNASMPGEDTGEVVHRSRVKTEEVKKPPSEALTLNEYAILFDAMARSQASIHFVAARWRAARLERAASQTLHGRQQQRLMGTPLEERGVTVNGNVPECEDGETGESDRDKAVSTVVNTNTSNGIRECTHPPRVNEVTATFASQVGRTQPLPTSLSEGTAKADSVASTWHPLLNAEVYSEVARQLIGSVMRRRAQLQAVVVQRTSASAGASLFPPSSSQQDALAADVDETSAAEDEEETVETTPKHSERSVFSSLASQKPPQRSLWDGVDTVSFFFLTRALGKLSYLEPHLIAALLPGMAGYLEKHPEQYLGIVLLVGRTDNEATDPALTHTLTQSLTNRLLKRQQALAKTHTRKGRVCEAKNGGEGNSHSPRVRDAEMPEDAVMSASAGMGGESPSVLMCTSLGFDSLSGVDGADNDIVDGAESEYDDEDRLGLLSEPATPSASAPTPTRGVIEETAQRFAVAQHQSLLPPQFHTFAVSLIDITSFYRFLACLCHQYALTMRVLSGGGGGADGSNSVATAAGVPEAPVMRQDMLRLYLLLLDDTYNGVPRLSSLFRLSPVLLEQTLVQVLEANGLLGGASHTQGAEKSHLENAVTDGSGAIQNGFESAASTRLWRHPLLLELVYVWTRHVAQGKLVTGGASTTSSAGGAPSRQMITHTLLTHGVFERYTPVHRRPVSTSTLDHRHHSMQRKGARTRHRYGSQSSMIKSGRRGGPKGARSAGDTTGEGPRVVHGNYDAEGERIIENGEHDGEDVGTVMTARLPCLVMPLPMLRAHAPRVLASVYEAATTREAKRQKHFASSSRWVPIANASPSADLSGTEAAAGNEKVAQRQGVQLARHFARFSSAVGGRSR